MIYLEVNNEQVHILENEKFIKYKKYIFNFDNSSSTYIKCNSQSDVYIYNSY